MDDGRRLPPTRLPVRAVGGAPGPAPTGPPREPIRVLVVDDQELFRRGLALVLGAEDGIALAGEAGDGAAAVDLAAVTAPDVVLLDVRMPGQSGVTTCARLSAACPTARIIMLASSEEENDLYEAVCHGASGFLGKDASIEEVAQAVRLVADGQSLISPALAVKLLEELEQPGQTGRGSGARPRLTERELEVLLHVARGYHNKEIAHALAISENTVKNHVRNILEKLQLHSRVEAVVYAVREKLLDLR